jgi:hypothetical protein
MEQLALLLPHFTVVQYGDCYNRQSFSRRNERKNNDEPGQHTGA